MQKKIVALAVAGLSTAAFAQTNVTIYGVADVAGIGMSQSNIKGAGSNWSGGNTFNAQSNSSLLGFKGTEDLGNGLKALFQAETTLYLTGQSAGVNAGSGNLFGTTGMRDSYIGLSSKYGTGLAGYLSTPFRSSLTSFDVMPGATGLSQIDKQMGSMRFGSVDGLTLSSAIRATAVAYAMPTLYGFNASIAYTGTNNNGTTKATAATDCDAVYTSACTITPQSAWGMNLGWTGYGVNVQGAFQQANVQVTTNSTGLTNPGNLGDYTSYLVGAAYTGIQNLKLSTVYIRNSLGTNGTTDVTTGAGKISNNQLYAGASYRMGNWEPRVSATWSSDNDGSTVQQMGSRQWTANVGYYLSKRTQVYGVISNLNNSANQNYTMGQQASRLGYPGATLSSTTTGSNLFGYGVGMRTTF